MSKKDNPLMRKTAVNVETVEPSDDDIVLMNERFPGMPPLSMRERKRLAQLEGVVTKNFKAFYEVGCALREISDAKLYRETHGTFADYAQDLWDMQRARAYQMIDAANIVDRLIPYTEELKNICNCAQNENVKNFRQNEILPQNDSQARALAKYPEMQQVKIWHQAVASADGRITAAHVKRTARRMHGESVEKAVKKARNSTKEQEIKMSETFKDAFNAFLSAIDEERLKDWKETDPVVAGRYVEGLLQAIEAPL